MQIKIDEKTKLHKVVHVCNPSYGGRQRGLRSKVGKSETLSEKLKQKRAGMCDSSGKALT
jgi:hypothetical protein